MAASLRPGLPSRSQSFDVMESPRSTSFNFASPLPFLQSFPSVVRPRPIKSLSLPRLGGKSSLGSSTSLDAALPPPVPSMPLPMPVPLPILKFVIPKRIVTPATPVIDPPVDSYSSFPSSGPSGSSSPLLSDDSGTGLGILAEPLPPAPPSPYPTYDESLLSPNRIPEHVKHPRMRRQSAPAVVASQPPSTLFFPWLASGRGEDACDPLTIRIQPPTPGASSSTFTPAPSAAFAPLSHSPASSTSDLELDDRNGMECPSSPALSNWQTDAELDHEADEEAGEDSPGSPVPRPLQSALWSTYFSPPSRTASTFPVGPAVLGIADYSFPSVSAAGGAQHVAGPFAASPLGPYSVDSLDSPLTPADYDSDEDGGCPSYFDSPRTIRSHHRTSLSAQPPTSLSLRRTSSDSQLWATMAADGSRRRSSSDSHFWDSLDERDRERERRGSQTERIESSETFVKGRRGGSEAGLMGVDEGEERGPMSPDSPLMSPNTPISPSEMEYFALKKRLQTPPTPSPSNPRSPPRLRLSIPLPSPTRSTISLPSPTSESPFPAPSMTVFRPPFAEALAKSALSKPLPSPGSTGPSGQAPVGASARPMMARKHANYSLPSGVRTESSPLSLASLHQQTYPTPNYHQPPPRRPSVPIVIPVSSGMRAGGVRRSSIELRKKTILSARAEADARRQARKLSMELKKMAAHETDPQVSKEMLQGAAVLTAVAAPRKTSLTGDQTRRGSVGSRRGSIDLAGSRRGSVDHSGSRRSSIDLVAVRRLSAERRGSIDLMATRRASGERRSSIDLLAARRASGERTGSIDTSAGRRASGEARRSSIDRIGAVKRSSIDQGPKRSSIDQGRRASIDRSIVGRGSIDQGVRRTSIDAGRRTSIDRAGGPPLSVAAIVNRRRSSIDRRRTSATMAALAEVAARAAAQAAETLSPEIEPVSTLATVQASPLLTPSMEAPIKLSTRRMSSQRSRPPVAASARGRSSPPPPVPASQSLPPIPVAPSQSRSSGANALDVLIGEVERELNKDQARVKRRMRQARLANWFSNMKPGEVGR